VEPAPLRRCLCGFWFTTCELCGRHPATPLELLALEAGVSPDGLRDYLQGEIECLVQVAGREDGE
jgi:hypothetical protein